jgi:polysaccharide biosynthesis transport protein
VSKFYKSVQKVNGEAITRTPQSVDVIKLLQAGHSSSQAPEDPTLEGNREVAATFPPPCPHLTTAFPEWQQFLRPLRTYWRSCTLFAAAFFTIVAIITYSITPVYESTARLEIDPPGLETFSLTPDKSNPQDPQYIETQAAILKSDGLAIAVIRNLRLDGNAIVVGKPARAAATSADGATQLSAPENLALKYYQEHLNVSSIRNSRLLEVRFASPDSQLSAQVVNTLVESFIQENYEARYDAVMHASEWLSRQMDDIRKKADASTRALTNYQKAHGIVVVDEKQSSVSQKIADLNHQLTQAETDRIQLEAYLKGIRAGQQESLPQIRENPMMQALTQHLIETEAELSQVQTVYGENSSNVQKLKHRIDELQSRIAAEETKIVREITTNYEAARSREKLMSQEIMGATQEMSAMAQYNSLQREAQRDADLYNSLYARIKEVGITAASKSSNVRVVDKARVLDRPTWPRRGRCLVISLVLALLGGVVFAFVREGFDNSIRTAADVEKWTGLTSLTLLPTMKTRLSDTSMKQGMSAQAFLDQPFSLDAEAVRNLQTSILLSNPDKSPRLLLIVSPFPGEGKTTVAVKLAVALSRRGRTCLVDADLRKSGVAAVLHLNWESGLSDVLRGSVDLRNGLIAVPNRPGLEVLHAGPLSPDLDHLLSSSRMRNLVQELRDSFEYVVIDSPPLGPYADGRVLSSLVDGVILVGRCGSTTRQAIARCAHMLATLRAPVLGVVLNDVDLSSPDYQHYPYG